jgi:hypothetical protein
MIQAVAETVKKQWDTSSPSPTAKSSAAKASAQVGQDLHISPREERTTDELTKLQQDASDFWN